MQRNALICAVVWCFAGCGADAPPEPSEPTERRPEPTVFDPLTGTIDRARGVQQTLDEQEAERRRQLEEAER